MAPPSRSQLHNTCGNHASGSNTSDGSLPRVSLAGPPWREPTPIRRDPYRPPGDGAPPEVGPVVAPPLAVTTAMEEDTDPAVIAPSEVVASMVRARTPPLDPAVPGARRARC